MAGTNNAINLSAAGIVRYDGNGTFTGQTLTQYSILTGGASNQIVSVGAATNGQLLIGSTGTTPALATITAGSGISITNGAGSITISSSAATYPWTNVSGTSQSMAVNNAYIANNAALVTLTLPVTANIGDSIVVAGLGAGGWTIAQNSGQSIIFNSTTSTTGVGGSLASTLRYDVVSVVCLVANTTWRVLSSQGNITVT